MVAIGHFELQPATASRVHRSVVFTDSLLDCPSMDTRFLARGPFKDDDGGSLGGSARLLDTRVLCTDILVGQSLTGNCPVSGRNFKHWVVRRYIDFLILLIPTPLVSALFCSSIPTFCFIFLNVFRSCSSTFL